MVTVGPVTATKETDLPLHTINRPTKQAVSPLHTSRTVTGYNLDTTTAAGIVRCSNTLGTITSLIEFILKSFPGEASTPPAEEVGAAIMKYWEGNVTIL